ncbi:hypothetical protein [Nocardia sp. NPDC051750]|uniref:hypothetical protein n=1 Tax=Nocardia sp. NPDC051750 TaxID=3364325 RepID=UPI0037951297
MSRACGRVDIDIGRIVTEFLCLLVVAGFVALLFVLRAQRTNRKVRMSCGECAYKTAWSPKSPAEATLVGHYGQRHPGIAPSGLLEWRQ